MINKKKIKNGRIGTKTVGKELDLLSNKKETLENKIKIDNLKQKINVYYETKTNAARIRSRVNWYEKGEKSTSYFFNIEKKNGQDNLWSKIKTWMEWNLQGKHTRNVRSASKFLRKIV